MAKLSQRMSGIFYFLTLPQIPSIYLNKKGPNEQNSAGAKKSEVIFLRGAK